MKDFVNYSLLAHNTFGIDARCHRFVEFESEEEARQLVLSLTGADYPLLIVGGGSNLLLTGDYPSTVIHSAIRGIDVVYEDADEVILRCGSGEVWDDVVDFCVANDYFGAENLSIIPGEVGASAVQNIGAYGVEAKDLIECVEAISITTGEKVMFSGEECEYSYRQSRFKKEWRDKYLITYVSYRLTHEFVARLDYGNIISTLEAEAASRGEVFDAANVTAREVRRAIIGIRNAKLPDPKVEGNAGSFFMNPIVDRKEFERLQSEFPDLRYFAVTDPVTGAESYKIPAGWMIEQCGWKGKSLGKAGVHSKQALVLVNRGGASGNDIVRLCETIREDVRKKFGVVIYPEVNIK